jgi:putative Holliday junction resolvase
MTPSVISLDDLACAIPPKARLIGVDLGTKTIGLALSDIERRVASPLETIARTKFTKDVERLAGIVRRYEAAALVVGWPLNMDGSEGPRTQATRSFLRLALPILGIPACLWDERLSTAAVTRSMIEQDLSRAKRATAVDRLAAAYILEGALLRLRRLAEDAASGA